MFKPKTVNGVMAVFTKTMADLDKVAEANATKAAGISLKRAELKKQEQIARIEEAKATKFRANLARMLEE